MGKAKIYHSAISWGLVIFLLFPLLGVMIADIYFQTWMASAIILLSLLFIFYLYQTTVYWLEEDTRVLRIKSGFLINQRISIDEIYKIEASNSMLSAPAWSLNRIAIYFGNKQSVLISPKHQEAFLEDLKRLNSEIKISV
ncbi:PH domain-containing protein [Persicobacter sp. CCB-QB2]|uniref:PH domain-containing protein n=1 Tax=Persicobacter sp. CCB-QB2 TaxID=1561025 RepID=UPI0006A9EEE3|nr:PH domain-containing protein [Persicobacter sp. CCB-QB2]